MASLVSQPPAVRIKALSDQMRLFSEPQHPVKIGMHWYHAGYKPSDLDIMLNVAWPVWHYARERLNYPSEPAKIRVYRELGTRLKEEVEAIRLIYLQCNWADERVEHLDVQAQDALIAWARYMGGDSLPQERVDRLKERMGAYYPQLPDDFAAVHHGILSFSPIWVWFDLDYPNPLFHLYKLMKRELEEEKAKEFLAAINRSPFQPRHLCKFAIWFRAKMGEEYLPEWGNLLRDLHRQGLEIFDKRDPRLIAKYACLRIGSRIYVDGQQLTLIEELKLPSMLGVYAVWRVEVGGNRIKNTLFLLNNDQVSNRIPEATVFDVPQEVPLFCSGEGDVDQFAVGEVLFGKDFRATLEHASVISDQTLLRLKELSESRGPWYSLSIHLSSMASNEEDGTLITLPGSRERVDQEDRYNLKCFYEGIAEMPEIPQWRIDLFEHAYSTPRDYYEEESKWGLRWGNDSEWRQETRTSLIVEIKPIAHKLMPQFTQAEVYRAVEVAIARLDEPMDARSRFIRAKPWLCGIHMIKWVIAAAKESIEGAPQTAIEL